MAFESPIVLCGLFVTGGVQFWIMARFILLLARSRGTGAVVACVTGWLVMRLPLVELVDGLANRNVQIVMAIAAPLVAAVLFEVACALLRRAAEAPSAGKSCVACGGVVSFCRKPDGSRALPKTIFGVPQLGPFHVASSRNERISTCLVMFVAAAVLAVVCSISDMGLWGVTNVVISESSPWLLGVAVPAVLVVVFACCALVLPNKLPLAVRFQPALFLTLAGLFAAAMQPSSSGEGLAALTMIIQISQLFARLLFWTVIATSLEVLDMPSYRTVGLGEAVYASVSLVWVSLLADAPKFVTLAVMFGLYILAIGLLYAVWGLSNRWGAPSRSPLRPLSRFPLPRMSVRSQVAALPLTVERVSIPLARGCSRPSTVTAPSAPCSTNVLHSPKSAVYLPARPRCLSCLCRGARTRSSKASLGWRQAR